MKHVNRIYQIVPYYPPNLGGMQKCAKIISEILSQKGYYVTVLTSDIGTKSGVVVINKNLTVKYLKSMEVFHTPLSYQLFFELLKVPKGSIVHLHIANAFYPELVYLISKIIGYRYIIHLHIDVKPSSLMGKLLPVYKRLVLKRVFQRSNTIICLTDSFKRLLIQNYEIPDSKIVIVPNGVGNEFFINRATHSADLYNILYVGRLSIQKNLTLLIKAISNVKSKVILHIVGEGDQRRNLEKMINRFELSNVIFHGMKKDKELLQLYAQADFFVMTSINEGMSLAMLEAMAAGLPIIAPDTPEIHDLISGNGILIPRPSALSYANNIDLLVNNSLLRKKLADASIKKARLYKWENSVSCIINLYKGII